MLWALIPVVSKQGQTDLDNHQFLFYSSFISFLLFFILSVFTKEYKVFYALKLPEFLKAVFLGFLGTYLYYILLYFGYKHAKGLEVLVLQYSWPVFIVFLSSIILKEKITKRKMLAVALGFLGVFIILSKGNFTQIHLVNLKVDIMVLFAAFVFALFSVLSKKITLDALSLNTIYFLTATLFSFVSMIMFSHFKVPDFKSLYPILINGLLVNGISYLFWIKALKNAKASFLAPFIFLTPIISSIYLVILFKEVFLPVYLVGMALVIIGGILGIV
jgi:drug/metabolite transporter (DMT)-like permease